MRILLVATIATATSVAHAERTTTVNLGGMFGGAERQIDENVQMKPAGGPRITLAWEHAPTAATPEGHRARHLVRAGADGRRADE